MLRKRGFTAALSAILAAALLVAAAGVGSAVPSTARLADTVTPPGLDLSAEQSQPLARVQSSFINEQLGFGPAALAPVASPGDAVEKHFACVNGHQTDDPLSPPCDTSAVVSNAGASYQGVTANEIRVVIAATGGAPPCGSTDDACPGPVKPGDDNSWVDLDKPQGSLVLARALRDYGAYFNARFQTYGRRVHLYLYFMKLQDTYGVATSRVQAKHIIEALHPFAVVLQFAPNSDEVAAELARRGVPAFSDLWSPPRQADYYAQYPNRIWGYWPTIEQTADSFASYVCRKVLPYPVSISGQGDNGKPRKIGLVYGMYHDTPYSSQTAVEVRKRVEACGGHIADEGAFVNGNGCHTNDFRHTPVGEASIIARFKAEGITTVLWPTCIGSQLAYAARAAAFQPEWIALGDYEFDANGPVSASGLSPLFDKHAVIVTPATVEPPLHQKRCYAALHSVDPTIVDYDAFSVCRNYNQFRQLFTTIQLAGPSLGPASIGRGIQSLPAVASTDPLVPTCSYAADDTACVKDAMAMYWDANAATAYNLFSPKGCWKVIEAGRRYLPGAWPAGNVDAQERSDDRCNDHDNDFNALVIDAYGRVYLGVAAPDRSHVTSGIPGLPETLS